MEFVPTPPLLDHAIPCGLQQHPFYAKALEQMGSGVQVFLAMDAGKSVARLQIVERNIGPVILRWLPRGPVWMAPVSAQLKSEVIRLFPDQFDRPAIWVSNPEDETQSMLFRQQGHRVILTPQHVAEIDLTAAQDVRLRAQHGKWRNRLRHAQKAGFTIRHRRFNPQQDAALIALEEMQRQDRRYSAHSPAFLQAWTMANPGATRIILAMQGGDVQAYLLLLLHAPTASYHIGWTGPEGRRLSAHNLLLWQAANWLASKGYTRLDLGNVDTQNAPGLARFKIGSGATVRPLGPTVLRLPRFRLRRQRHHAVA